MKINDEEDEISKSFQNRYQNNLEKLMKSSKFVFSYVHLLYYKCYKINLNCGYIYRFYWLDKKQKNNNKYNQSKIWQILLIQYNSRFKSWRKKNICKELKKNLFINKYNWEGINVLLEKDGWKDFEKNNLKIAFNILYPKKNTYISWLCFKT